MAGLLDGTVQWALAAGLIGIHSWFITWPVIKLWRTCEADKAALRKEHAEIIQRVTRLENGGHDE